MRKSTQRVRRTVRYEAARIMAEEGIRDFKIAKDKARLRVGVSGGRVVPSNLEIEDSLSEHLQIFQKESVSQLQHEFLEAACDLMKLLRDYSPRLVGAALTGNITLARPIELQVFADALEDVHDLLLEDGLQCRIMEKRPRFYRGFHNISGIELVFQQIDVEILVFLRSDPYPPLSPINGKPIEKASLKKISKMLMQQ